MSTKKECLIYSQDPQFDKAILDHNKVSNEIIGFVVMEIVEKFFSNKKSESKSRNKGFFGGI